MKINPSSSTLLVVVALVAAAAGASASSAQQYVSEIKVRRTSLNGVSTTGRPGWCGLLAGWLLLLLLLLLFVEDNVKVHRLFSCRLFFEDYQVAKNASGICVTSQELRLETGSYYTALLCHCQLGSAHILTRPPVALLFLLHVSSSSTPTTKNNNYKRSATMPSTTT